ncbi:MAG TPA: hypothetical protein VGI12_08305 [Vicinamibacterales bacterium]|jgi:CheY-like chemotaxis protein
MAPLVLVIEPDSRQAAIVKRIVREKVVADVAVVDSRDSALDAMRTMVPDVLLLSALLSPRDEDELIAHLRTLEHVAHLQTHTIPQLASSIGSDDDKPARGLLSAFRRRKTAGTAPAGCDPDLFAEEIRTYLHHAAEKKREIREAAALGVTAASPRAVAAAAQAAANAGTQPAETEAAAPVSSWESPFEWRPSGGTAEARTSETAHASASQGDAATEPPAVEPIATGFADAAPMAYEAIAAQPAATEFVAAESVAEEFAQGNLVSSDAPGIDAFTESETADAADGLADLRRAFVAPEPTPAPEPVSEPVVLAVEPEPPALAPEPLMMAPEPSVVLPPVAPKARLPLVQRHAREWWYEDGHPRPRVTDTDSELREVLASLSIPFHIAAVGYAEGCRIRRVRLSGN